MYTNREAFELTVEEILKLLSANEGPKEASNKLRALRSVHLLIKNHHSATHQNILVLSKLSIQSAAQTCRLDSAPKVLGHG
jgi:hypothetical protein